LAQGKLGDIHDKPAAVVFIHSNGQTFRGSLTQIDGGVPATAPYAANSPHCSSKLPLNKRNFLLFFCYQTSPNPYEPTMARAAREL